MYCPFSIDKKKGEEKEGQFRTFCDSPFYKEYKKNNSFYIIQKYLDFANLQKKS